VATLLWLEKIVKKTASARSAWREPWQTFSAACGLKLVSHNVNILILTLDVSQNVSLNTVLTTSEEIRNRYDDGGIRPSVEHRAGPRSAA
jgi:hypothetical protein